MLLKNYFAYLAIPWVLFALCSAPLAYAGENEDLTAEYQAIIEEFGHINGAINELIAVQLGTSISRTQEQSVIDHTLTLVATVDWSQTTESNDQLIFDLVSVIAVFQPLADRLNWDNPSSLGGRTRKPLRYEIQTTVLILDHLLDNAPGYLRVLIQNPPLEQGILGALHSLYASGKDVAYSHLAFDHHTRLSFLTGSSPSAKMAALLNHISIEVRKIRKSGTTRDYLLISQYKLRSDVSSAEALSEWARSNGIYFSDLQKRDEFPENLMDIFYMVGRVQYRSNLMRELLDLLEHLLPYIFYRDSDSAQVLDQRQLETAWSVLEGVIRARPQVPSFGDVNPDETTDEPWKKAKFLLGWKLSNPSEASIAQGRRWLQDNDLELQRVGAVVAGSMYDNIANPREFIRALEDPQIAEMAASNDPIRRRGAVVWVEEVVRVSIIRHDSILLNLGNSPRYALELPLVQAALTQASHWLEAAATIESNRFSGPGAEVPTESRQIIMLIEKILGEIVESNVVDEASAILLRVRGNQSFGLHGCGEAFKLDKE